MVLSQMYLLECFVEDILNYNMVQSGAFTLKPVNFDPRKVLEFIKSTFKEKFKSKNLELSVKYVKRLTLEVNNEDHVQMRRVAGRNSSQLLLHPDDS